LPGKIFAPDSTSELRPAVTVSERELTASKVETLRVKDERLSPLSDPTGSGGAFGT
jgi:hypothetical protein